MLAIIEICQYNRLEACFKRISRSKNKINGEVYYEKII